MKLNNVLWMWIERKAEVFANFLQKHFQSHEAEMITSRDNICWGNNIQLRTPNATEQKIKYGNSNARKVCRFHLAIGKIMSKLQWNDHRWICCENKLLIWRTLLIINLPCFVETIKTYCSFLNQINLQKNFCNIKLIN